MNPIVFAMRRPMTVMVGVVAVALGSILAVQRMSIDIFPNLNLPVIYVAQPYGGMDPAQMEGLLTNYYEYHFLYIGGIHHVESRNIQGMALMKLFFHPGTDMAQAMAETIGYVTRSRAFMPPGTVSPFITRFDAGSVPVGYLVMSSETKTIGEIQDQALFKVRPMFASLPGVSAPPPFGGSQRTVVVRVDPERLRSYRMSPDEVTNALTTGNTISPSGNVRIGDKMPIVPINTLVRQVEELGTIPIRLGASPTVYLRDVASIKDASDIPTGYALVNGRRAVYILVTKRADASTLSVVENVKEALPKMQAVLPDDIRVSFEFDQSPTVTRAVSSLVTEGALGAALTGLMVLVFLRDWRSVIVVVLNIPFALAGALVALWLSGQTINLMTLGGLALAIGILVDEATVEIENIHHKLESAPSVPLAVRQGNLDTAVPRLLAMLCILAVFIPSFFMQGAARALFVPLSLAVGFAMVASYLLSSTFVPVLSAWLMKQDTTRRHETRRSSFDRLRDAYGRLLAGIVRLRWLIVPAYLAAAAFLVYSVGGGLGREIFPRVDVGRFQLRIKAPTGTRIERTEQVAVAALDAIREEVGPEGVEISLGYVGNIPSSYPINAIYQWTGGPEEVVLRVALKPGNHASIEAIKAKLRDRFAAEMPDVRFSFEPADIVSEVMSFGSPTPIEVAVNGPSLPENRAYIEKVRAELAQIPSLRDLQAVQPFDYPTVNVDLDREKAGQSGVTVAEIARSVVAATSSSRFVVPNYWPDPKTGIGYQVQVEVPYAIMDSIGQVETIPIQRPGGASLLLRDVARVTPGTMPGAYDRYNMKRVVSLTANIAGEDLGRVSGRVAEALKRAGEPPKGATLDVRGQVAPFNEMLRGLSIGLGMALVVILLLLTANFQSFRLALVVVSTTPAVLLGVVAALALTGTTINIQSFNGAIMAIGVAVANAILLVTFAERGRRAGVGAAPAAVEGARGRLRPILMTSCAMIAGMAPLALGWGEGGEHTAPLGRAVVGGLAAATLATLFILPGVFAILMGGVGRRSASLDPFDSESSYYRGDGASDEARSTHTNGLSADSGPGPGTAAVPAGVAHVGLVLVATLAWTASGCARPSAGKDGPSSLSSSPSRSATKVEVVKPVRQAVRRAVEEPGQIEPCEVAPLHAKVSGYARNITVDIGDRVKKGQVLTELWVPEVEADLRQKEAMVDQADSRKVQAEASVEVARAGLASAEAKLTEAQAGIKKVEAELARWQSEYNRTNQLVSERAVTGSVLDEARSRLQGADAARDAFRASVKSAEAALLEARSMVDKARADVVATAAGVEVARSEAHRAEVLLAYTKIEAPFDGVVTRRHIDTGHLTIEGPHGDPLFVIARTDVVTFVVGVPEVYAVAVEPGDKVQARIQALGGRTVDGKVSRTAHVLDAETRTLRVEIDVPNPDGTLRPGLYVNTNVIAEEHADVLTVPETALVRESGKVSCIVVADGHARRRAVEAGLSDGKATEIVSGLREGEAVVKVNTGSLVDGQAVAPVDPPPPAKP